MNETSKKKTLIFIEFELKLLVSLPCYYLERKNKGKIKIFHAIDFYL